MRTKMHLLIGSLIGLALLVIGIQKLSADEFYKDKTIRFVVGQAAGGGYDLAARTIGRHMGKHIPGNPTIVVENMTGTGRLIAANYTYNSGSRRYSPGGVSQTYRDPEFHKEYKKLTADDPTPLMPEAHEKVIREIPRDREVSEIFKKLVGAGPLPQR